jgi:hypothetical protein
MPGRTAVITAIALTVVGALYFVYSPSSADFKMLKSGSTSNGVPGLEFKLSQISKSPPSALVTLKNSSPSTTYTILKWGTPLDPPSINMGVLKLIDADTGNEINTDVIKIARKMPPAREDLQEIAPGTEHATEVVFDLPWMPKKTPAKYRVKAEGTFHGVWEKAASDVKAHELEAYTESPYDGTSYASEEAILIVE